MWRVACGVWRVASENCANYVLYGGKEPKVEKVRNL